MSKAKEYEEKRKEYEKQLLDVINKNNIVKFTHAFPFAPFSRATAYNYNLEQLDSIKDAMENNKARTKVNLINKWIESDNATLNLAAYRLCADPEEHQKLNQQYIDHTTNGERINIINLGDGEKPDDEAI